jgi:hypothetical protein
MEELLINEKNGLPKLKALTRDLYIARGITLKSWMHLPTFRVSNRGTCVFNTRISLYLSFRPIDFNPDARLTAVEKRMCTYEVTPRNYAQFEEFFSGIARWVVSPAVEQIFDRDPVDNRLRVSDDFRGSSILLKDESNSKGMQAIRVSPMTCDGKDGRTYPGAKFEINQEDFVTVLPSYDLIAISNIISDFSFQEEQYLLMSMLTHKEIMMQDQNDYGDWIERENPFLPASHPVN